MTAEGSILFGEQLLSGVMVQGGRRYGGFTCINILSA
jgi:hypothetical protein